MNRNLPYVSSKPNFFLALVLLSSSISAGAYDPPPTPPANQQSETGEDESSLAEQEVDEARVKAIPIFNEGVAALESNDLATALERFQQASAVDSDFAEAFNAAAAVAMEIDDFRAAADAAENLVRLQPENVDAIGTAYFAELMLADIDRLIPSARRLADANPAVVSNEMLQHARVLFDDNLLEGSRSLLSIIIEREPELAPAYFQLGLTCNMMGETECARQALQKFLELAPDDEDAATARSLLEYL
jgi:tetratricopeptide (TPR) repeat protein